MEQDQRPSDVFSSSILFERRIQQGPTNVMNETEIQSMMESLHKEREEKSQSSIGGLAWSSLMLLKSLTVSVSSRVVNPVAYGINSVLVQPTGSLVLRWIKHLTPRRARELSRIIGNVAINSLGLSRTPEALAAIESAQIAGDSAISMIATEQGQQFIVDSSLLLIKFIEALNTPEALAAIEQFTTTIVRFLDTVSTPQAKRFFANTTDYIDKMLAVGSSPSTAVAIAEFTANFCHALEKEAKADLDSEIASVVSEFQSSSTPNATHSSDTHPQSFNDTQFIRVIEPTETESKSVDFFKSGPKENESGNFTRGVRGSYTSSYTSGIDRAESKAPNPFRRMTTRKRHDLLPDWKEEIGILHARERRVRTRQQETKAREDKETKEDKETREDKETSQARQGQTSSLVESYEQLRAALLDSRARESKEDDPPTGHSLVNAMNSSINALGRTRPEGPFEIEVLVGWFVIIVVLVWIILGWIGLVHVLSR